MNEKTKSKIIEYLPAIATGIMLVLCFPPFNLSMLVWIALVPLLLSIYGATGQQSLRRSLLAGFIYFTGVMPWIYIVLHDFGHIWFGLAFMLYLLLMAYLSLYIGLFGYMVTSAAISPARIFIAPVAMVVLEYIRSHLLTGLPWALLAHSQAFTPPVIQMAEVTGTSGVTFLITLVNSAIAYLLLETRRKKIPIKGIITVTFILLIAWKNYQLGEKRILFIENQPHETVKVALIQGNTDQAIKWNPEFKEAVTKKYEELTKKASDDGAELFVWPETAVQFYFGHSAADSERLIKFSKTLNGPLLFGGLGTKPKKGTEEYRITNRAFGLENGKLVGQYDKMHLVPFGEYVPLRKLLFFVDTITDKLSGDIVEGTSTKPITLKGIPLGVQICFEVMFPGQTRDFYLNKARMMINITNDVWFGRTGASAQHMAALPFRAVENRIPIVRAANSGISGFVAATGKITQPTNIYEEAVIIEDVQVPLAPESFYGGYGEVLPWYFMAMLFIGLPLLAGGKREDEGTSNRR